MQSCLTCLCDHDLHLGDCHCLHLNFGKHASNLACAPCRNAASSLRISTAGPGMVNEDLDPLDNSRVHPEHYRTLVKRLCHEALQAASSGGR